MNTYMNYVNELIDRYDHDIDNGLIDCYLPGHVSFGDLKDHMAHQEFYDTLESKLNNVTYETNDEYRKIVQKTVFDMLDEVELINGDMRDIFNNNFM